MFFLVFMQFVNLLNRRFTIVILFQLEIGSKRACIIYGAAYRVIPSVCHIQAVHRGTSSDAFLDGYCSGKIVDDRGLKERTTWI